MNKVGALIIVISFLATGFTPAEATKTTNPYGASTVDPAGSNEVIFTVSKGSKKVTYTTSQLMKIKSSTISIYEPFLKKRQSFTVIPISSFFSAVGISGGDKVLTNALNDYVYSNTAANFLSAGGYIAIKRNGTDIPYDQGGPLRIVFADTSKWARNLNAWNWSLASMATK
jgi:hypothetical protein